MDPEPERVYFDETAIAEGLISREQSPAAVVLTTGQLGGCHAITSANALDRAGYILDSFTNRNHRLRLDTRRARKQIEQVRQTFDVLPWIDITDLRELGLAEGGTETSTQRAISVTLAAVDACRPEYLVTERSALLASAPHDHCSIVTPYDLHTALLGIDY